MSSEPASNSGARHDPTEATEWPGTSLETGQAFVDHALARNSFVKFMMDKMGAAGCAVDKSFVKVEHCDAQVGGGFRPPDGVVICFNHLTSQEEVNNALTHELIHAYDHCRARNLDWTNLEHHACSEIRAASLSGDCDWGMEVARGNWALRGQHQACVRRRAELSVAMNPGCASKAHAARAVDAVFEPCFRDVAPFDRRP